MERLAEGLRRHPELLEQYIAISDRLREAEPAPAPLDEVVYEPAATATPPQTPTPQPWTRTTTRERLRRGAIKVLLDRRVELVEKLLEVRSDRFWEDCLERKPWLLQPVESWLVERHARARQARADFCRGYVSDGELHRERRPDRPEDRWKVSLLFFPTARAEAAVHTCQPMLYSLVYQGPSDDDDDVLRGRAAAASMPKVEHQGFVGADEAESGSVYADARCGRRCRTRARARAAAVLGDRARNLALAARLA